MTVMGSPVFRRRHPEWCNETYPGFLTDPISGTTHPVPRVCGLPKGHPGDHLSRFDPGWRERMRKLAAR